jgi:AcrR family transcriptional regulator
VSANERTRTRLLAATLVCVERWGLEKTSLEDVAKEAGLSRATVYRYFAGGREQLVHETVAWEVGRFFERIEREIAVEPDLAGKLRRGLMFGHQAIEEHTLLQRILATEPEALLEELSNTIPLIEQAVRAYLLALLRSEELRPGVSAVHAADYLTRLYLSYVGSQGQWDFGDADAVDELVRTQFLAGVVAAPPGEIGVS